MINRAAIILTYKQPAIDWINSVEPSDEESVSLSAANEERTIYLVDEEDAEDLDSLIGSLYKILFESEFLNWYSEEEFWPKKLSLAMFNDWFDVECDSVIEDLVGTEIVDDDE